MDVLDDLTTLTCIEVEHAQLSHIRTWSGCGQQTTGLLNGKCMICSASEPCSAIRSAQKLVFCRYLAIRGSYSTQMPRTRDAAIFVMTTTSMTADNRQKRLIALPLAHAGRVNITKVGMCIQR